MVFIDRSINDEKNDPRAKFRWSWVYAHGKFQEKYGYDIVLFNQDFPDEKGYFLANTENEEQVLIHISQGKGGYLKGRCCFVDDYEALEHINNPNDWM